MSQQISALQAKKFRENEIKRHNQEMRMLRNEHARKATKLRKEQDLKIENMGTDFEKKKADMKAKLELKLHEIRNQQKVIMEQEEERLGQELTNLKKKHEEKKSEIKIGQDNAIHEMVESHKRILDNAKRKFDNEKAKFNT